ncbi:MAG: LysR family transcriptional regulator [Hyphomicrobiales bacterium]
MKPPLAPEIAVFVRLSELGAFTAVAKETGYTSSGISRMISRLEDNLGAKLLHRSTRRLALTPEGEIYQKHARQILAAVEAAEADVSQVLGRPRGPLVINCGSAFARYKLAPELPGFLAQYPDISAEISVTDQRIDPMAQHADVTIRVGHLTDSDLIAIPLGTVSRIVAASPEYLASHGTPIHPDELRNHNCLLLKGFPKQATWPMQWDSKTIGVQVRGNISSDSADTLLHLAIAGAGIIRLGDFLGTKAVASGALVPLLADHHHADPQPITALVTPGRQSIPRVRTFIDFIKTLF